MNAEFRKSTPEGRKSGLNVENGAWNRKMDTCIPMGGLLLEQSPRPCPEMLVVRNILVVAVSLLREPYNVISSRVQLRGCAAVTLRLHAQWLRFNCV